WLIAPKLRGKPTPARPPIVLPPREVARAAAPDSIPAKQDTQVVQAPVAPVAEHLQSAPSSSVRTARGESSPSLKVPLSIGARRDTAIAQGTSDVSSAPPPATRVESASPLRVNYEEQATALFSSGDYPGARDKFLLATRYSPSARAWTNY